MKYGVFTVSTPEYNLEQTLKLLAELGYDGVEWRVAEIPKETTEDVPFEIRYWSNNKSTLNINTIEEEADTILHLCQTHGIEIFGLTTYLQPDMYEALEKVLAAAKHMGTKQVRVFTPSYSGDESFEEIFDQTRKHIGVNEALASRYGVKVVYEIHMDNILASPSASRRLLEGFDPNHIGIIFDPGNMVYEGFEDYQKSFEMLGDYIAHVHIKNGILIEAGRDTNGSKQWKRKWVPLWDGMADLAQVFRIMKTAGYKGNVSVEDFSNESQTYDKLKENLAYMKKLEKAAEM